MEEEVVFEDEERAESQRRLDLARLLIQRKQIGEWKKQCKEATKNQIPERYVLSNLFICVL
jgi:hypothetical protein